MAGETIITVGNPYGYEQTVTTGIVSGLNREIAMPSGEKLKGIIQTNAVVTKDYDLRRPKVDLTAKKEAPPDAKEWEGVANKFESHFSANPGGGD